MAIFFILLTLIYFKTHYIEVFQLCTLKKAIAIFLPQLLSGLPFLLPFVATCSCFNTTIKTKHHKLKQV
tara:strand:- start:338 stop:544 length:207 start_codon:yes stop_codon:yes gene_type:complete